MSEIELRPVVRDLLHEAGLVFVEDTPARLLLQDRPGLNELSTLAVAGEQGYTVIETGDRGEQTVRLWTDAPQALDRYLLRTAGRVVRRAAGHRALVITGTDVPHPGIDVEDVGPSNVLRWESDGRRRWADCGGMLDALKLARELLAPVEDLIASYRDPDGLPVYSQGRRDPAGRRRR